MPSCVYQMQLMCTTTRLILIISPAVELHNIKIVYISWSLYRSDRDGALAMEKRVALYN